MKAAIETFTLTKKYGASNGAGKNTTMKMILGLTKPDSGSLKVLGTAGIQEMWELVRSLPPKYGMTVLESSHLLSEIDQMANYTGIAGR